MRPRAALIDVHGLFLREYRGEVWVGTLLRLMEELGYNPEAVRVALSRMVADEWLSNRRIGRKSYYALTERSRRRLEEAAGRLFGVDSVAWDGRWRLLTYSVPEGRRADRDRLRRELTWLGFGPLSSSTWITPTPLFERARGVLEAQGLKEYVALFTAEHHGPGADRSLAEKCWDLAAINRRYSQFIADVRPRLLMARHGRGPLPDNACFVAQVRLVHAFRKFLFVDPGLPGSLLPRDWRGHEARRVFREYFALLDPGATRFFLAAFAAAPDRPQDRTALLACLRGRLRGAARPLPLRSALHRMEG
jgi:phenylacetic acid degradation operon negative regulatory protein